MSASEIINVILAVAAVILACFECKSRIKNIIISAVNEAINFAENRNLASSEKMEKTIGFVVAEIPAIFKPFCNKRFIQKIIQDAFNKVTKFVETQDHKKK